MSDGPDAKTVNESGMKQQVIAAAKQFIETVDKKVSQISAIKDTADKAGTKPAYLVLGGASLVLFIVMMIIGFNAIVNMICYGYPAYAALKAMQEKEDAFEQQKQWITYFMIFGFFSVAESFYPALLTDVAFYVLLKLFFLVWCFLPMSMGATKLYDLILAKVGGLLAPKAEKAE
mmetsp:Transcript_20952/g.29359  ORF Transcript_20952/g.29359 Transcript_20952/m.29359 type:complete len:175 (+) Transcript_20952:85-609(+)|eukprot:CAMPEP_0185254872 /NCGR_PEP_ID=MMETSP1359-20130426/3826_1 /TAXON_ID=552665 /ORGANISM="Bigelowiella longifila, Strain CCMP242" /LENGTH=174 /DNA_ID=CAMNT_0027838331 /DNA_START=55 /DNA_END=579 /DNA_ORIENTATION=-